MGAGKVITDGLVLFLDAGNNRSYSGTGTTWTDLSSTAITGSLTNGPIFSSANGGSVVFDGTNDYVDITSSTHLNQPLTMEAWININTQHNGMILSRGTGNYEMYTFTDGIIYTYWGDAYNTTINNPSITTGSWNQFCFSLSGTTENVYKNGVFIGSRTLNTSPVYTNTGNLNLGRRNSGTTYFSGSIGFIKLYNRVLSSDEILQNYESTRERFNLRGIAIDPDASLFLRTAGITDTTQQSAIDTLVLELKNAGIWSKMKAIYPFVGGTASTHKWNLKDPRDVDAAFRLSFSGGWTHSSNGALPNGTNAYADTFMIANPTISETSNHLSYYSRTIGSGTSTVRQDIGAADSPSYNSNILLAIRQSGVYYAISFTNAALASMISNTNADSHGFYNNSRTSSTSHKAYKNGVQIGSTNTTVTSGYSSMTSARIYIGATSVSGTGINNYSDRECAFATIGDGLTDSEVSTLYTIVQKYQTTLGRQV
jgi:hypothetical protein